MASYISSNNNRFYVATEAAYGQVSAMSPQNRIPAVKLTARQQSEKANRKDKTGSRTFPGDPTSLRRATSFSLNTYMTGWSDQTQAPNYGPLFQACLGGAANLWAGGTVSTAVSPTRLAFVAPHGLVPGQAICIGGEIRFVSAIVDARTVQINAPFAITPLANTQVTATATYQPASELPSVSIFDSWSPATAVQRVLSGAAMQEMKVKVNGDFHEFTFSGSAADLIDSASFQSGQGGLTSYPQEPAVNPLSYSIIPGHLGEVWLGSTPSQFFTVTKAELTINNDLTLRDQEFGAMVARGISPGIRNVSLELSLYQEDDAGSQALYQAARQRSPISVMLQLGQQQGQLFGVYMSSVIPEVPEFDDSEKRLQWHFVNCRAQGGLNDEIFVAFG